MRFVRKILWYFQGMILIYFLLLYCFTCQKELEEILDSVPLVQLFSSKIQNCNWLVPFINSRTGLF